MRKYFKKQTITNDRCSEEYVARTSERKGSEKNTYLLKTYRKIPPIYCLHSAQPTSVSMAPRESSSVVTNHQVHYRDNTGDTHGECSKVIWQCNANRNRYRHEDSNVLNSNIFNPAHHVGPIFLSSFYVYFQMSWVFRAHAYWSAGWLVDWMTLNVILVPAYFRLHFYIFFIGGCTICWSCYIGVYTTFGPFYFFLIVFHGCGVYSSTPERLEPVLWPTLVFFTVPSWESTQLKFTVPSRWEILHLLSRPIPSQTTCLVVISTSRPVSSSILLPPTFSKMSHLAPSRISDTVISFYYLWPQSSESARILVVLDVDGWKHQFSGKNSQLIQ